MSAGRFLAWLTAAALAGFAVFGVLVWRAVEVTTAMPSEAQAAFDTARAPFDRIPALITRNDDGTLTPRPLPPPSSPAAIGTISVLSYETSTGRLVRADVPFWFYRLKAPAAGFMLAGTGLDFDTLGLTAADLAREGPTIVLDESTGARRLLVWTR